jgi:DNA-directed RNA polymerase specialized sigma54-like protein
MLNKSNFLTNKKVQQAILDEIFIYSPYYKSHKSSTVLIKAMDEEGFFSEKVKSAYAYVYNYLDAFPEKVSIRIVERIGERDYHQTFYIGKGQIQEMLNAIQKGEV